MDIGSQQAGALPGSTVGRTWPHGMMSSVRQDWATPRSLFEMLDREFRFRLDACATALNRAATPKYLDVEKCDALKEDWAQHERIWLNPPYGRKIGFWIEKALRESRRGSTVVMLIPARTDTQWWHDYCMKGEIRFLRGRLTFDDKKRGRCPFPSAIVIFREATA